MEQAEIYVNATMLVTGMKTGLLALAILAGLASMQMGYSLFSRETASASGRGEGAGFKITLTKVGPGVFFALFGSIVIVTALVNQPKFAIDSGPAAAQSGISIADSVGQMSARASADAPSGSEPRVVRSPPEPSN